MFSKTDQMIRDAIANRQQLDIVYNRYQRKIEVYVYGELTNGNVCIRAFQHAGGSKSGHGQREWKLFDLDKISSISLGGERFAVIQREYNRNDNDFRKIYAAV